MIMGSGEMLARTDALTDKARQWLKSINDASATRGNTHTPAARVQPPAGIEPGVISFNAVIQDMDDLRGG